MLTQLKGIINLDIVFRSIVCFPLYSFQHVPLTYRPLSKQDYCTQVNSKSKREHGAPVPLREKKLGKAPLNSIHTSPKLGVLCSLALV